VTDDASDAAEEKALPKSVEWRKTRAMELRGAERRTHLEHVEFRDNPDGSLHLSGYASVTNTPYDMGWYSESISRGAFAKTLAENPDVQLLVNHAGLPLARTKSGTLQLSEDNTGLRVDADLDPEDPDVQSLSRKMKRGDIDQMSFAFRATRQSWDEDYTDRQITECDIHRGDVSVVNQGANPSTSVSVRTEDALVALRHIGHLGFLEAMLDIRRFSGTPLEQRAGMTLSAATTEVLTQVLALIATADEAVDEAQPLLADLMGVPNPDEPEEDASDATVDDTSDEGDDGDQGGDEGEQDSARSVSLALEARRRLEALRYPKKDAA
jgi:HK97 family phage prohead protease